MTVTAKIYDVFIARISPVYGGSLREEARKDEKKREETRNERK